MTIIAYNEKSIKINIIIIYQKCKKLPKERPKTGQGVSQLLILDTQDSSHIPPSVSEFSSSPLPS